MCEVVVSGGGRCGCVEICVGMRVGVSVGGIHM